MTTDAEKLRIAARRCTRHNADVALLCEHALAAADRLEVLEREHTEFFDRWHNERRKREKLAHDVEQCYQMLLSEPNTKNALFNAENMLRETLAEQKVCAGRTAPEAAKVNPSITCEVKE